MRRTAPTSFALLTAMGLALASPAAARTVFDDAAFDRYVADAVETWEAPGLAVANVKDGEIVFERGYGLSELPSRAAADYAGAYADPLYGRVGVTNGADGLRLRYGPGLAGPLEHWHHDTFLVRWDAAWRGETFVTFRLGPDGAVRSLQMNGAEFRRAANP